MQQRKERRKSRKTCLQVLYSNDVVGVKTEDVLSGKATLPHIDKIDEYASNLISGTVEKMSEIDELLSSVSQN